MDLVRQRRRPQPRERAAAGVHRQVVARALVVPARAHHPRVVAVEVALLRHRRRRLVPRVALVDRVAERVVGHEHLAVRLPVLVVGGAEQDPDAEVDVDEVGRDQLAVDDDARGDEHLVAPVAHRLVVVGAEVRVVERAPAVQEHAPAADLLIARQRLVEEVEDVVVHRDGLLDEVQAAHQPDLVVRQQRRRRHRADAARVDRGRVHVAPLHQADHLAPDPAHVQRLAVRRARERVERRHDVRDRRVAVLVAARRGGVLRLRPHARVGRRDHLLAEVDEDQIVLEDDVVEDVLGGLAEVDDPLGQRRRLDGVGHLLRVAGADRVVVAADAADAAGDEVRVARVLALHEHAVAAEQRRRRLAADHLAAVEVDLGVDAEVADDARDRVPRHVDDAAGLGLDGLTGGGHVSSPRAVGSPWSAQARCAATSVPC